MTPRHPVRVLMEFDNGHTVAFDCKDCDVSVDVYNETRPAVPGDPVYSPFYRSQVPTGRSTVSIRMDGGVAKDYRHVSFHYEPEEDRAMFATKAFHPVAGDLSREGGDVCFVYARLGHWLVGRWATGLGYVDVLFPSRFVRELTDEEVLHYRGKRLDVAGFTEKWPPPIGGEDA